MLDPFLLVVTTYSLQHWLHVSFSQPKMYLLYITVTVDNDFLFTAI
jgi:hypothetical protein